MASGKQTPRQKMINMMYLVLTALLALNVSKEILDSFVTVNNGLETTKLTLKEKMDATYASFSSLAAENPKKFGKAWGEAQAVQTMAADLVSHIDRIKVKVISATEGLPEDKVIGKDEKGRDTILNLSLVGKKDDNNKITELMVGSEPSKPKEGELTARELRTKIEAFRDKIKQVAASNPGLAAQVDRVFDLSDRADASGTMNNWESINFYHVPLAAGITILSKLQSDVRNIENECVGYLMGEVEGKAMKFSELAPVVLPVSNYITVGDSFRADVYLAGYDPLNPPVVELSKNGTIDTVKMEVVGDKEIVPIGADGKGKLRLPGQGVGSKEWKGIIKFKQAGQEEKRYPFYANYEVAQPNVVVSPTKMNVFYRGIDNPVDVSVPGFSADKITPSIDNGSITKAAQGYTVKPGSGSEATVSVSVEMPNGQRKSMPGVKFRVKSVPNPTPVFANKGVGDATVKKAELTAAAGVIARMEGFEFDLKFEVVEFNIGVSVSGTYAEKSTKGNKISQEQKELLGKVKAGSKVYVDNIKVRKPDGTITGIGSLSLKVV